MGAMRIVVVTPSFDQAGYLRETVCSIGAAGDGGVEVVQRVVDGGSTDGTPEYLSSLDASSESPVDVSWVSEADRGQSDAINKGMRWAAAEAFGGAGADVVAWLNSDDVYLPGALERVAEAFAAHPDVRWLVGDCVIIDERGRRIREMIRRYKRRGLRRYSYDRLLRENVISQPAVFWRRCFGESVALPNGDLLDESLHYAMDYDLWLRMGRACDPLILDEPLAGFRVHGGSKTHTDHASQFAEQLAVVERYCEEPAVLRANRRRAWMAQVGYKALGLVGS